MTEPTDIVYLHPVESSVPTEQDHKEACYAFMQRMIHHGLLVMDVRWSNQQDQWVLMFGMKGAVKL